MRLDPEENSCLPRSKYKNVFGQVTSQPRINMVKTKNCEYIRSPYLNPTHRGRRQRKCKQRGGAKDGIKAMIVSKNVQRSSKKGSLYKKGEEFPGCLPGNATVSAHLVFTWLNVWQNFSFPIFQRLVIINDDVN